MAVYVLWLIEWAIRYKWFKKALLCPEQYFEDEDFKYQFLTEIIIAQ